MYTICNCAHEADIPVPSIHFATKGTFSLHKQPVICHLWKNEKSFRSYVLAYENHEISGKMTKKTGLIHKQGGLGRINHLLTFDTM
jgi:hypothetical protein